MTEYMPTDAYSLLRRLVVGGPQKHVGRTIDEDAAAKFLVSRGFAAWEDDGRLGATTAGVAFGRVLRPG